MSSAQKKIVWIPYASLGSIRKFIKAPATPKAKANGAAKAPLDYVPEGNGAEPEGNAPQGAEPKGNAPQGAEPEGSEPYATFDVLVGEDELARQFAEALGDVVDPDAPPGFSRVDYYLDLYRTRLPELASKVAEYKEVETPDAGGIEWSFVKETNAQGKEVSRIQFKICGTVIDLHRPMPDRKDAKGVLVAGLGNENGDLVWKGNDRPPAGEDGKVKFTMDISIRRSRGVTVKPWNHGKPPAPRGGNAVRGRARPRG